MRRFVLRRLLSLLLVLCLVVAGGGVLPAFASQDVSGGGGQDDGQERLEELQDELNVVLGEIDRLKGDIAANKNAAEAARALQAYYQQQAAILEEQITLKVQEIEQKEREIEQKRVEIADKQAEFDQNDILFVARLNAMYRMNDASVLSTLLAANTFSEFLTMADGLLRISQHDTQLLAELERQRLELERIQIELEVMLAALQADRDEMNKKLEEYNASIVAQQGVVSAAMAAVAQSQAELDEQYRLYQQQMAEMEAIWRSLGDTSPVYVGGQFGWPVPGYNHISSYYGWRILYGRQDFHTGIDVARGSHSSILGATIVAANAGQVVYVGYGNTGYGNYLIIDHGGGYKTLYAHCQSINVAYGAYVTREQPIATVGNTGNSTGPHLHFEIRISNEKVNPLPYVSGQVNPT